MLRIYYGGSREMINLPTCFPTDPGRQPQRAAGSSLRSHLLYAEGQATKQSEEVVFTL